MSLFIIWNILKLADRDKTIELLGYPAGDGFTKEIVDKKVSTLNLWEHFPTLPIPPWLFPIYAKAYDDSPVVSTMKALLVG